MKYIFSLACLLCFSGVIYAQMLSPAELVSMRKAGKEQIDSIMRAKKFRESSPPPKSPWSYGGYTFMSMDNGVKIGRCLLVSWHHDPEYQELTYDMVQQQEQQDWFDQLQKAGFTTTAPDSLDRNEKGQTAVFGRNNGRIFYRERVAGGGLKHYIHSAFDDVSERRLSNWRKTGTGSMNSIIDHLLLHRHRRLPPFILLIA